MMYFGRGPALTVSTSANDDFERSSLGTNWTATLGSPVTVNSSDLGAGSFSGVHIATWAGASFLPDQFCEAKIAPDLVSNMQHQVFVRRRSSDAARYAFHYNGEATPSPRWEIKYDGVATEFTYLLATSTDPAPVPGDTLRLEARGTNPVTIKGYHNGVLLLTGTDSTADRITSGPPGLVFRAFVGASLTYPSPVFENWSGGTLIY